MNFASALFSLRRGHKIRRKHWIGFLELGEDGEVYMYCNECDNLMVPTDGGYKCPVCGCTDGSTLY